MLPEPSVETTGHVRLTIRLVGADNALGRLLCVVMRKHARIDFVQFQRGGAEHLVHLELTAEAERLPHVVSAIEREVQVVAVSRREASGSRR
jgi:hypothetical protein